MLHLKQRLPRDGHIPEPDILAHHPEARLKLIRLREKRGLTRPELARRLGVSRTTIFRGELYGVTPPIEAAQRWLEALGRSKRSIQLFEPRQRRRPQ